MSTKRFIALAVLLVLAGGIIVVAVTLPWNDAASSSSVPVFVAGDSITVKDGDTFVVALAANPTTGYSWTAADNDNVQFVKSKQVQGDTNLAGAPGTQMLTFEATSKGSSTLKLEYARPFEKDTPPAQTQTFPVTVR